MHIEHLPAISQALLGVVMVAEILVIATAVEFYRRSAAHRQRAQQLNRRIAEIDQRLAQLDDFIQNHPDPQ